MAVEKKSADYLAQVIHCARQEKKYPFNYLRQNIAIEHRMLLKAVLRRKYWYIDIPRTSSTSIKTVLGNKFGYPYGKQFIPGEPRDKEREFLSSMLLPAHTPAFLAIDILGQHVWGKVKTFSVVRNPYSWCISLWHFSLRYGLFKGFRNNTFINFITSFQEKLAPPMDERSLHLPPSYLFSQGDYLTSLDGQLIVQDILKFEDRAAINDYLTHMDPTMKPLQITAKTDSEHYDLSQQEKILVETVFKKDFELLGY